MNCAVLLNSQVLVTLLHERERTLDINTNKLELCFL